MTTPIKAPERVTLYQCDDCGKLCLPPTTLHSHGWAAHPFTKIEYVPAHHTVPRALAVELAEALKRIREKAFVRWHTEPSMAADTSALEFIHRQAMVALQRAQSSGLLEPEETGAHGD